MNYNLCTFSSKLAATYCIMFSFSILVFGQTPNIIIILADDMGYGDATCYNKASKIPTDHIDQLASEGMRFTDAHSPSSVCTPTRYGLLTGRYAWRTKLKKSVLWPWDPPLIEEDRLTLPQMLKEKGYKTACIGKWHLGWNWKDQNGEIVHTNVYNASYNREKRYEIGKKVDFHQNIEGGPLAYGFDYYFGDDVPNFPPYTFIENDRITQYPYAQKPSEMFGHEGPAVAGWDLSLVMPKLTQRAVQYIDDYGTSQQEAPFFLYLPLTAPHTPIAPSPHFIGTSQAGWYGDYVMEVDWTVGQLLTALKRNQLDENTLVIFTSDNGSPQRNGENMNGPTASVKTYGHDPSYPWRGMKSDIWEGGHRVPFIAKWHENIPTNTVSAEPIILVDLMKTIARILNYELPTNAGEDSYDILDVFKGKAPQKPIRDHLIHHSGGGIFAIRVGEWKLILGRSSGGFTRYEPAADAPEGQLYNLFDDPHEENNLYHAYPEKVAALKKRLELEF